MDERARLHIHVLASGSPDEGRAAVAASPYEGGQRHDGDQRNAAGDQRQQRGLRQRLVGRRRGLLPLLRGVLRHARPRFHRHRLHVRLLVAGGAQAGDQVRGGHSLRQLRLRQRGSKHHHVQPHALARGLHALRAVYLYRRCRERQLRRQGLGDEGPQLRRDPAQRDGTQGDGAPYVVDVRELVAHRGALHGARAREGGQFRAHAGGGVDARPGSAWSTAAAPVVAAAVVVAHAAPAVVAAALARGAHGVRGGRGAASAVHADRRTSGQRRGAQGLHRAGILDLHAALLLHTQVQVVELGDAGVVEQLGVAPHLLHGLERGVHGDGLRVPVCADVELGRDAPRAGSVGVLQVAGHGVAVVPHAVH